MMAAMLSAVNLTVLRILSTVGAAGTWARIAAYVYAWIGLL